MEMNPHDVTHLFLQLGLPAERAQREAFVREHPLPPGTRLSEAAFWSPSQAEFLKRSIADDASWAAAADQLAALLSPAMPASEAD